MSFWNERITFKWFLQFYAGLKIFQYVGALALVPREIQLGRPLRFPVPFNEFDLRWRVGIRALMLGVWLLVFLWAGGRIWAASPKENR